MTTTYRSNHMTIVRKVGDIVEKQYLNMEHSRQHHPEFNDQYVEAFMNPNVAYHREVQILQRLSGKPGFPTLIDFNDDILTIRMEYCGEPLTEYNVPNNWKHQMIAIITTLESYNLIHNDMHINNWLVHHDSLCLIDFDKTQTERAYPFYNINLKDVKRSKDVIRLFKRKFKEVFPLRIEFEQQYGKMFTDIKAYYKYLFKARFRGKVKQ